MKKKIFTLFKFIAFFLLLVGFVPHIQGQTEKRYYFVKDGALPTGQNLECVDYRIGLSSDVTITVNQMTRDESAGHLAFVRPGSGWWSFDLKSAGELVNLTDVDDDWTFTIKLKTTVTHNPINIIFYNSTSSSSVTYQLTDANFPDRSGTQFTELNIPITDFPSSLNFSVPFPVTWNFFSLHADNSGISDAIIEIEEMYLSGLIGLPEPDTDLIIPTGGTTLSSNESYRDITFMDETSTLTIAAGVNIKATTLTLQVSKEGNAPQILLEDGAKLTVGTFQVEKELAADAWSLVSVPFNYLLSSLKIKSSDTPVDYSEVGIIVHSPIIHAGETDEYWIKAEDYTQEEIVSTYSGTPARQNVSYGIGVKADHPMLDGDYIVITGNNVIIEGKNIEMGCIHATGAMHVENFNFAGTPTLYDYTGILQSPEADARPTSQQGIVTYTYNRATDNFTPNLPVSGPVTMRAYDVQLVQTYKNIFVPVTPLVTPPMNYETTHNFDIHLAVDGTDKDMAKLIFMKNANDNFEQNEDGVKISGFESTTPALYLLDENNVRLSASVMATPENDQAKTIKLGLNAAVAGSYVINARTINAFSSGNSEIYLIDKENGNSEVDILQSDYTFNVATTGIMEDRFELKAVPAVPTFIEKIAGSDDLKVSYLDGQLTVSQASGISEVRIIDLNGKVVRSDTASGQTYSKTITLPKGIYLIETISADSSVNRMKMVF
ncbi:MAG: T9SS type A sorting domain-containing protein [Candidatus Azobacteroides sp.]|nr:T9SS type A sorting domain-containing protein [Candidatus Azobacteroides sp.]